jgi:hypothetical protein
MKVRHSPNTSVQFFLAIIALEVKLSIMATKQDEKAEQAFFAKKAKEPATTLPGKSKEQAPVVQPAGTMAVKPSDLEPLDHGDKRAFQTGPEPGQREMLTKAEAEKRGFHWAETEGDKKKK